MAAEKKTNPAPFETKRLYNDWETMVPDSFGVVVDREISDLFRAILNVGMEAGYSIRDMAHVAQDAIRSVEAEECLRRNINARRLVTPPAR